MKRGANYLYMVPKDIFVFIAKKLKKKDIDNLTQCSKKTNNVLKKNIYRQDYTYTIKSDKDFNYEFIQTVRKIRIRYQIQILEPLSTLVNLQYLSLSNFRGPGGLEPLSTLVNLQYLDIHRFSGPGGLEPLSTLVNLQSLSLSNFRGPGGLEPLSTLVNLQSLYLCSFSGPGGLEPLSTLVNLQSLYLNCFEGNYKTFKLKYKL